MRADRVERKGRRVLPANPPIHREPAAGKRRRLQRELRHLEITKRVGALHVYQRAVVEQLAVGGTEREAGAGFDIAEGHEPAARDAEAACALDVEQPLLEPVRAIALSAGRLFALFLSVVRGACLD